MPVPLVDYVRANVSIKTFYSHFFPELHWPESGSEARVSCCFHKDGQTPSLHFNPETGAWFCHGCDAGGNSIISFYEELKGVDRELAAEEIFERFIHPVIPETQVVKWHNALINTPKIMEYLSSQKRLLNRDLIKQFKLGWDGLRIVVPIRNEFGLCVNAKMYDPLYHKHGTYKMVNYSSKTEKRQFGVPVMLFPIIAFELARELGYIVVCEGEWDTLFLLSIGIPAITTTGGCKSWPKQYNELFRGLRVIIAYDNDKDGYKYDKRVVLPNLDKVVKSLRRLHIPPKARGHIQKDVTEWARNWPPMRKASGWRAEFKKAELLIKNPDQIVERGGITDVPLDLASEAKWFHRKIRVQALVTGKITTPYIIPKSYRVSCKKSCEGCPIADHQKSYKQCVVDPPDPKTLKLVDVSDSQLRRELLNRGGFIGDKECECQIDVVETFNVEALALIPSLDSRSSQYVVTSAYYIGHGLHPNRAYNFEGVTTVHPATQEATQLFEVARPVQDEIENFQLTRELIEQLKIFQPKLKILAHLMAIAEWQSRNVTKILERPDLHVAVDLVFHSVGGFRFNGEQVTRGMLDVLVLGDTRCGKGYVAERLTKFYGLGEVASGENCTFAGLIGGLQQVGKKWAVTWGLIPLNHRRQVVIDEASALSVEEIGKMSRVRSEGIAEVVKIKRESTQANTRLIWLSNTRSGQPISIAANTGIEAVKQLVGANEDISRFDFAMTVATGEVPSEVINAKQDQEHADKDKYSAELFRSLILWAWSRRPEQVTFTERARNNIIRGAIAMGARYSSQIPLVQSENVRLKLAKISAAIAARCFSTDGSGSLVLVDHRHVRAAVHFLDTIYTKPSMGYDLYSESAVKVAVPNEPKPTESLKRIMSQFGHERLAVLHGLARLHRIDPGTLGDYVGDVHAAKDLIGSLVRIGALYRVEDQGGYYVKEPNFTQQLRSLNGVNDKYKQLDRSKKNGTYPKP